jgi:hypothetical protein
MSEYDIFGNDDGELEMPTMRGSANLDVQDYQGIYGPSSILDDGLQEDVPSTPGRNPGAASATDVEGTSDFDMLRVPGGMDAPGMKQTTYGASPWGPGSHAGYRPYSQQRTDMELRALGAVDLDAAHTERKPMEQDDMSLEPEVIDAVPVQAVGPWDQEWHGERNQQPSNANVDPMTLYDRESYEYDESSQDTIGNGIFGMEEGVTWRPRDGSFAHQYALPAYIGDEDELGVQQSAMWDSTADEWRVTQPSASGVSLARKVSKMKGAYTPFGPGTMPEMRPEVTGPRSNIEAFGRKAAKCLVVEARAHSPANRSRFLNSAIEALGPGAAARARKAADKLIRLGYRPDVALEDAIAHCVMHAAVKDMTQRGKSNRNALPRLDRMAKSVRKQSGHMMAAATRHLQPLTSNGTTLRKDLGALYNSPAARGMGSVTEGEPTAPPSNGEPAANGGVFTTRNMLIAGGVGVVGYLLYTNRDTIAKNVKKIMR